MGIRGAQRNPPTWRWTIHEYKAGGLFGGIAGGMYGFKKARHPTAKFRVVGSIDNDAAACRDYERLIGSRQACLDLFSREQWIAYHSRYDRRGRLVTRVEPPSGWEELSIEAFRAAFSGEIPNALFTSSPCQGLSGLLSNTKAATPRYAALNELTVRGLFLAMEAWGDDPPGVILFENVPRIDTRGRPLLLQIVALLDHYGYAVQETIHDCGELGGLAQHRKRFLMVARHRDKVRPFLYVPPKRRVRAIKEVLWDKPLPGDVVNGGKMHQMIRAKWKTWVRLALIRKGKDWRDLHHAVGKYVIRQLREDEVVVMGAAAVDIPRMGQHKHMRMYAADGPAGTVTGTNDIRSGSLLVADDRLAGEHVYRVEPAAGRDPVVVDGKLALRKRRGHNNVFVVLGADQAAPAVNGGGGPSSGAASVADDRLVPGDWGDFSGRMHVQGAAEPARTVTGAPGVSGGAPVVADDRLVAGGGGRYSGKLRVEDADEPAHTVIGTDRLGSGAPSVADPRPVSWGDYHAYGVADPEKPSETVTAKAGPGAGSFSTADPRPAKEYFAQSYGVADPELSAPTVTAEAAPSTGRWSVADPQPALPYFRNTLGVADPSGPAMTVTTRSAPTTGEWSVADERFLTGLADERAAFQNGGHYGVQDPAEPSGAVTARGKYDNGRFSVADDRLEELLEELPGPDDILDPWPIIIAPDGTVHRPMTPADLAWLQGFPTHFDDGSVFELDGPWSSHWRRRIGNAVPPPAAQAIAESILRTLELNRAGATFNLSSDPIWVEQQRELVVDDHHRREALDTVQRLRAELN